MNVKNIDVQKSGNLGIVESRANNIKPVSNNSKTTNTLSDSLEISDDARKLQYIKNKIEEGFYTQNEILKKTAEKIFLKINF